MAADIGGISMVGRVQTKNLPGTIAMVITFTASVFLVHLFRPTPAVKNAEWTRTACTLVLQPRLDRIQSGSPLKFAEIEHWPDSPNVAIVVKNVSGRAISTFALAATTKGTKSKIYVSSHSLNAMFPVVLKSRETYSWVLNLDQVGEIWVDFVEFSDRTTWGPDTTRTAAALNAERTGARIAALRYERILKFRDLKQCWQRFPNQSMMNNRQSVIRTGNAFLTQA